MTELGEHEHQIAAELARYEPLPINAFGALPHQASKIPGLGGPYPPDDPAYVFKTLPIRPALGLVTFTVAVVGLQATRGTLVIRVTSTMMVADALPVPVKTIPVLLNDLSAKFGVIEITIESKRNVFYTLTAHIFDETDATATGIAITLDRREESDPQRVRPTEDELSALHDSSNPKIKARPEMISIAAPVLAWPASQAMTSAQFTEKPFGEWLTKLGRPVERTTRNWIDTYILQVIRHFVPPTPGNRVLGIGATGIDIPENMAGRGWQVMLAPAPDGGDAHLEHENYLTRETKHEQIGDVAIRQTGPVDLLSLQGHFVDLDFLWSVNVPNGQTGHSLFPKFLAESIICLKPGAIAVHVFDYSGTLDPLPADSNSFAYSRSEIERMALAAVSHGQEVAQMKFALASVDQPRHGQSIPFGMIVRRQW